MNKPEKIRVYLRYLGIFRLMTGKKEEILEFNESASVEEVLNTLKELLSADMYSQLQNQTLMLSSRVGEPGRVLNPQTDKDLILQDGNCITVVTPVTGG